MLKKIAVCISIAMLSNIVHANEANNSLQTNSVQENQRQEKTEELNKKIQNILNKKVYLKVDTPEQYIDNLDTTNFVKGLLLESVALSDSIATNKNNPIKLQSIAQDVINNTACQQVIMGKESLFHYQKLMNLLFKTEDERKNFVEGQKNMEQFASKVKFDQEFIEYCKGQTYYEK